MDAREKVLRAFEQATEEVARRERDLIESVTRRDALRRELRELLRRTSDVEDGDAAVELPESVTATAKVVTEAGDALSAEQVAERMQVTPSIARTRLQRATKLGLLARVSRGRYGAPSAPGATAA